jgi:GNAT superfamily N-acetyltransferase
MEIVIASIADIEELTQVEIESKLRSFTTNEAYAVDLEHRLRGWQTYFAAQTPASAKPERIVYKALENDNIIGFIAVHLTTRYNLDAEIQTFYILKAYQRKGIGSKLLNEALKWLSKFKVESLCVGIFPENPYKSFYLKHGGQYLNPHWIYWDNMEDLGNKIE